jgi:tRNA threonylcarbamoyladenosine biosynthesis protein TsaE
MSDQAKSLISANPRETEALGAEIAVDLLPGDMVLLEGEVGTGKSTLIRSALVALGVSGPIPSPTYTIGRSYKGDLPISHLDLHRIASIDAEDPGLLSEYFGDDRIVFVEWPGGSFETLEGMALRVLRLSLFHEGADRRRIVIAAMRRPS